MPQEAVEIKLLSARVPMDEVSNDQRPDSEQEIPTTVLWRKMMRERREAKGLSQTQVAQAVRVSQPMVSSIERGTSGSSSVVYAISKLLGMAPPIVGLEPDVERLVNAALTLRERSPAQFAAALITVEALAGITPEDSGTH